MKLFLGLVVGVAALLGGGPVSAFDPYVDVSGPPQLNPGGLGQVAIAPVYDVRPVGNLDPGFLVDAGSLDQDTLLSIVNASTTNAVLARVRFRRASDGAAAEEFDIVLTCNEVWTAAVILGGDTAEIFSGSPVVVSKGDTLVETDDALREGEAFALKESALGFWEVIAEESLPSCEPRLADGVFDCEVPGDVTSGCMFDRTEGCALSGRVGSRASICAPPNSLGATTHLVQPSLGVTHEARSVAIANFTSAGIDFALTDSRPTLCDDSDDFRQLEAALSKNLLLGKWTLEPAIAGETSFVVTFPTLPCHGDLPGAPFNSSLEPPGPRASYQILDRHENAAAEEEITFSPSPDPTVAPPLQVVNLIAPRTEECQEGGRETLCIGVPTGAGGDPLVAEPDVDFRTGLLKIGLDVEGQGDARSGGFLCRCEVHAVYNGLPTIGLVLTEFMNGNGQGPEGALFGSTVEPFHTVDCADLPPPPPSPPTVTTTTATTTTTRRVTTSLIVTTSSTTTVPTSSTTTTATTSTTTTTLVGVCDTMPCQGPQVPGPACSTVACVCALPGNDCSGGVATIDAPTLIECGSELDFEGAGFPAVRIGSTVELERASDCFMDFRVGSLAVEQGASMRACRNRNQRPGRIAVAASDWISVAGTLAAVGGSGGSPYPATVELLADSGDVNIGGGIVARGTTARGFGGHIIIGSSAGGVTIGETACLIAHGEDPGRCLIDIDSCGDIEVAGLVDGGCKKSGAQVLLTSHGRISVGGGQIRADLTIGELRGNPHELRLEARSDVTVASGFLSANAGSTNKEGGTISLLSSEGTVSVDGASTIKANATAGGSDGGLVELRGLRDVVYDGTIEARGNGRSGFAGSVLLQSFGGDVTGSGTVEARGARPGTCLLRACSSPVSDGGTFVGCTPTVEGGTCTSAPPIGPCGP